MPLLATVLTERKGTAIDRDPNDGGAFFMRRAKRAQVANQTRDARVDLEQLLK
jgi:hypothetical protein